MADIRCNPPISGSSCEADFKKQICECSDTAGGLPYFIGSSRTYMYYAKWFADGWLYPSPAVSEINSAEGSDVIQEECWATRSIANIGGVFQGPSNLTYFNGALILPSATNNYQRDDVLFHYYLYNLMSESIDEYSNEIVKWVDDDIITWNAAKFLLVFWLTGCGEPCYTCAYESYCGPEDGIPGNEQLQAFIRGLTNHWLSIYEDPKKGFFAHESFPQDYYGRLYQVPEPIIGWQLYFLDQCNYCGCIIFCILKRCRDEWVTKTGFFSRLFLFNRYSGIPYRYPAPLINFALSVKEEAKLGSAPIMLDHMSDEYVWAHGYANLYNGRVQYSADGEGTPKDVTVTTLGKFIQDKYESDTIEGFYKNEANVIEATFTKAGAPASQEAGQGAGDEEKKYEVTYSDVLNGVPYGTSPPYAIPSDDDTPPLDQFPQYVRELAVKYKHSGNVADATALTTAGWLVVDVPEVIEPNITSVGFANDFGQLPDIWYDTTTALWGPYRNANQFFVRSVKTQGFMRQVYDANEGQMPSIECSFFPQVYGKQFAQKSIKAPYNLYFKQGEDTFRSCKLFETITDLEPGRYYFPNPYICRNHLLNWYDFNIMGGERGVHYEVDESEGEVYRYFNTSLPMQFLGRRNDIPLGDLQRRLFEAIRVLGYPWDKRADNTGPVNFYPMEDIMSRQNAPSFREVLADTLQNNPCTAGMLKQSMNDFFRDLFLAGYSEFMPG